MIKRRLREAQRVSERYKKWSPKNRRPGRQLSGSVHVLRWLPPLKIPRLSRHLGVSQRLKLARRHPLKTQLGQPYLLRPLQPRHLPQYRLRHRLHLLPPYGRTLKSLVPKSLCEISWRKRKGGRKRLPRNQLRLQHYVARMLKPLIKQVPPLH